MVHIVGVYMMMMMTSVVMVDRNALHGMRLQLSREMCSACAKELFQGSSGITADVTGSRRRR